MIQPILYNKLPDVERLLKENKVQRAYVFGSVCTESFKDESDIDFLISFEKDIGPIEYGENYFKILYALQKILKRDVDLMTEETLTNPYFIKVMNKTKTAIYEC
ncbi:MAG: nucleotidyltransferase domain-containing protein [Bacteroidales bacterium]|nr:nucleotidyltransferase domain-containing protein [Bacteroidales bacterium]